ncbi:OstA family protein [Flavobacteriaceae bacterium Ap0902]|nr:OstA family protein [Flavobacteriaceae bacterium Ap0902]
MHRIVIVFLLLPILFWGQQTNKKEKVKLVHSDKIESRPDYFDGNTFYSGSVVFQHANGTLSADTIVVDQNEKILTAFSNVKMIMDNNELTAEKVTYNNNTEISTATGDVVLRNPEQTLYTDKLEYNRNTNQAYYNTGGTIVSEESTITSQIGIYNLNTKSNTFNDEVRVTNQDYYIESKNIKHYSEGDYMDFNDETYIQNRKNPRQYIETTKGRYYLGKKEAYLENRSSVYSDGTVLTADDIYFNQNTGYGMGEGDVIIDNPEDQQYIRGGFGEFFREKDSAYVTQQAYAVKVFENDSFYLHADTLMSTKRLEKGLIRAFHAAKYFKSNLQGKADSISFYEGTGELRFFKDPVVWSGVRQITGDTIFVYSNVELERLDSIMIRENAFAISKTDSLTQTQFHQLKSRRMLGIFIEEQLDWILAEGNAQSLIYVEEENEEKPLAPKELTGINRSDCGIIEADVEDREINVISCKIKATSKFYPPSRIPDNERKFPGFLWRSDDRPLVWQDIFN